MESQVAAKIDGIKSPNTKSTEEIRVPLSGKIVELNQHLNTHPNLVLTETMDAGSHSIFLFPEFHRLVVV